MADIEDDMAKLLTQVVDAEDGYREGAELAKTPDMKAMFETLRSTHADHIIGLKAEMRALGLAADDDTSALAVVHKAILNIRSVFSGLDHDVVPGLIDGERRIIESYDDLIARVGAGQTLRQVLESQRNALNERIANLQAFGQAG
ncbi:PA2169 family four-helix-bundle protein [Paracoccaceae bacterium Fryx2]|nr:PA2169 family four-helix-bundle protein [Paracoccaceae bacterium Fryx2]